MMIDCTHCDSQSVELSSNYVLLLSVWDSHDWVATNLTSSGSDDCGWGARCRAHVV